MNSVNTNTVSKSGIMVALVAALTTAAACGSSDDKSPFTATTPPPGSGTDAGGTNNPPPSSGSDAGNPPGDKDSGSIGQGNQGTGIGCNTTPARYVVLGHSVAHCFAVGGVDSETCSIKSTHTYLATKFPGLKYENYAVDGAVIADVVQKQLATVPTGAGHLFVNLYIGGNDLAAHLYESDAQAKVSFENLKPQATKDMETILSYFDDASKFPDKATIMVNGQYNPFDECAAGIYSFVTTTKQGYIKDFNDLLAGVVANHKNSATVDQYTTFLGHGHNYNQSQCPKYLPGADDWMADMIHPNEKGHVNLAKEMRAVVDNMYKCN